jgi:hypothetical protein
VRQVFQARQAQSTAALPPEKQPQPPRVTTRLPQPPIYAVEQPTWYDEAVWNRVAIVGLGSDTPPLVTEPLSIDQLQTQYLPVERLDA